MSSINDLVDLQIAADSLVASVPAFGVPAIVVAAAGFGDLYRVYNSVDDIDADAAFTDVDGIRLAKLTLQQDPNAGEVVVISADNASTPADYELALTETLQAGQDFFGVVIDDHSGTQVTDIGAWAETNRRMFIAAPKVTAVADYDATAALLNATTPKFVHSLVSKANNEGDLAAALFGRVFAANPGAINWTHRALSGVVVDTWTSSERAALKLQSSGWYEKVAGLGMVRGGTATYEGFVSHGGHYPDVVRGTEWLSSVIKAAVVTLQSRADKVPFTDAGGAMIYNAIRPELSRAESDDYKLLVPGTTLNVPPAADVASADRAVREWTGITFDGQYQGAVNKVRIRGRVTV